ncbi:hypothetical protein EOA23_27765 [Mesorhizobium sp. M2A.F.Ca.ET.042.01.1.1]|uniref:hypothetical protein n=1 Tax=Mesorhizobium sp. M2A.F.Ca.ET.042.01.1.1 TaxID=2496745 RepID=UPI000FCC9709|nr:hypothetical protein [Mesorhizobium sp. M2A.F.Ca.ET.042.01.1.1]RUX20703.1 hypothetical protein EOA23_27765 [Mesorhizobium sp. M2A.F.Ca.ET.042.01.1.1]
MIAYLASESSFLRSAANKCLLLLFLAALTRMGGDTVSGNANVMGVTVQISQGLLIVAGPIISVLIALLMKYEVNSLELARYTILDEISGTSRRRPSQGVAYALLLLPPIASAFFTIQFVENLIPANAACNDFVRARMLYDFSLGNGEASIFCIGDVTKNMPWIYPPYQTYLYVILAIVSLYVSTQAIKSWNKFRG